MTYVTVIWSHNMEKVIKGSETDDIIQYDYSMLAL